MQISKFSQLTGASAKALRHYEAIGLIGPITRRGKYRDYTERDRYWVGLIRRAQSLGFSLAELKRLRLIEGGVDWPEVVAQVEAKQLQVAEAMQKLLQQQTELQKLHEELQRCCADDSLE